MSINKARSSATPFELQKQLQVVEDQLRKGPIDLQTRNGLFRRLEQIQEGCQQVHSVFSKTFSNPEEKVISLYGRVADRHVDFEVDEITSADLSTCSFHDMATIQKKINSLKSRHQLSIEHRKKISEVEHKQHEVEEGIQKAHTPPSSTLTF